jgi:hypothetical protein
LRMRGRVTATVGGWSVGTFVNHQGNYSDPPRGRSVDDWTTIDLSLVYEIDDRGGWLQDTRFQVSAINVLDEPPPFVNIRVGFDAANASEWGRMLSAQVAKQW